MPSKDQVKQAVNVLLRNAKYGNGKKTQMSEPGFSGLVSDVNTELEKLGHEQFYGSRGQNRAVYGSATGVFEHGCCSGFA